MKTFQIRQIKPDASWDAFARKEIGLIFYTSAWARTLEAGYKNHKGKSIAFVFEEDGEIVCGTMGIILEFGFIRIFFDSLPYGGLIGRKELLPEFLSQLEAALKKQGIHQIRITSHSFNRFELTEGYEARGASQHVIDLTGVTKEKLWKSYDSRTRWAIRKAMRENVVVHHVTAIEELKEYSVLFWKTMRRHQTVGPFPKEYFPAIFENLVSKGLAYIIFAKLKGKTIAAKLMMYNEDGVIDYFSVSDEDYFSYHANELLTHWAIDNTIERGGQYFDFATSYGYGDSLCKYKEKWGAKFHDFCTYTKNFTPWRCRLWDATWRFANTKFGSALLRSVRKFRG